MYNRKPNLIEFIRGFSQTLQSFRQIGIRSFYYHRCRSVPLMLNHLLSSIKIFSVFQRYDNCLRSLLTIIAYDHCLRSLLTIIAYDHCLRSLLTIVPLMLNHLLSSIKIFSVFQRYDNRFRIRKVLRQLQINH